MRAPASEKIALTWKLLSVWYMLLLGEVSALQSVVPKDATIARSGGWRVALNLGREAFSTMPPSWGSSGARFPLVIQCNFTDKGDVIPISHFVKYTLARGEVAKRVESGSWSLDKNRDLSFSLTFPETMERNGVELDAGSTVVCEGLIYTKDDLYALDQEFYDARSKNDRIIADVKEMKRRKEAPKKWNFETNKWERRYKDESLVSTVGKKLRLFTAEKFEERESGKRPNFKELSLEPGPFPGIGCNVYIKKEGFIKLRGKGFGGIIGTWAAEPINDNPASYYRSSY
jgi:hypothetical protein